MPEGALTIEGRVSGVVYQNEDNGYTVLRMEQEDGSEITVVGCIPDVSPGEGLLVTGQWVRHGVYGDQLRADVVERSMPAGEGAIFEFLASRAIRGVGARTARLLVDEFGADTLRVMEQSPELMTKIKGITRRRALEMSAALCRRLGMRRLLDFLAEYNLPAALAIPLHRRYGDEAPELLQENPYLLADAEFGVEFSVADALAISLGMDGDDPARLEAGLLFELAHNSDNGHTFLPYGKLLAATGQLLGLETQWLAPVLELLCESGAVVRETVAGEDAVYLKALYDAEDYVAIRLGEMCDEELLPPENIETIIDNIEREQGIQYAPEQRRAVRMAAASQVMLLTGGPGTGKTTTLRGVLALFDALGLETALAAPTGRAAKRMSEACGAEGMTIHRLLEARFDGANGALTFARNQSDPLRADAVIVDETSMVDISLMQALLMALRGDTRLILVGDADQLPSVGPGNVLSDLLRSGRVNAVRLTEIFRQARESAIVMHAHSVNHGEIPDLINRGGDFFFLRRTDPARVAETIAELCKTRLPEKMGIAPHQIQVLSPTRKGGTGTANLNRIIQEAVNPPAPEKGERRFGETIYRAGDRVMQIRNNYDLLWEEPATKCAGMGVFNGDIGRVEWVDERDGTMLVDFDGRQVEYTPDLLIQLEPAYAVTVHKAQGSEYRAVILAALDGAPMLLTRGVLYTAITRARELFIAVGDEGVIAQMVRSDRRQRRYSALRARLAKER